MRTRRFAGFALLVVFLASAMAAGPATQPSADDAVRLLKTVERAFIRAAAKVSPSVVSISTRRKADFSRNDWMDKIPDEEWQKYFNRPKEDFQKPETFSAGSGVIVDPSGLILTNNHVIEDAIAIEVRLADRRAFAATLVQTDTRSDLAIIRIDAKDLPAARFNTSGRVEVGQWVIALGNPFGFGQDGRASVSHGVVSALGRNLPGLAPGEDRYYGHLIQTDAPINPGNSGGPLLNLDGEVIGINTAIFSTSRGSQGLGFSIPIDEKTWAVIGKLRRGEEVAYGYLGVGVAEVTEAAGKRLGVEPRKGALVHRIEPDTPASKAGFQKDDVILAFNGVPVADEDELIREVGATPVGSKSTVDIVRDQKPVTLTVTLAKRSLALAATRPAAVPGSRPSDVTRGSWRGIAVQVVTKDLADRLGLAEPLGVLVNSVDRNSPAYLAGIRPGFVIDQIGKESITGVTDFRRVTEALPATWKGLVHTNNGFFVVGP